MPVRTNVDRGRLLLRLAKQVREQLVDSKTKDLTSKLDVLYYACELLSVMLFRFHVSFRLSMKFEEYMRKGVLILSDKNVTTKINEVISLYDELIQTIKVVLKE